MTDIYLCHARNVGDQLTSYNVAIAENPDNDAPAATSGRGKRSVATFSRLWANGRTLKIAFIDNELNELHKLAIIAAIKKWQSYVNLVFEFVDGREGTPEYGKGDIRITTDARSNYTLIGTDAKLNDPWTPTMVLGIKPADPKFESTVMHEFGHALGAEHEHQHPEAQIPRNIPAVYAHYAAAGYSKEVVDDSVLKKLEKSQTVYSAYDKNSIMHYPIPNTITLGDWEVGHNTTISAKDIELMHKSYPKQ